MAQDDAIETLECIDQPDHITVEIDHNEYVPMPPVNRYNVVIILPERLAALEAAERQLTAERTRREQAEHERDQAQAMIFFVCSHCGALADTPSPSLDSGTELICNACGKVTVVLLLTPAEYVAKVRP